METKPHSGGGGFFVTVFFLGILFAVFLLPDVANEFSLSLHSLPPLTFSKIKSIIAVPLLELSFSYIGANEYIGSIQGSSEEKPLPYDNGFNVLLLGIAGEGHISPLLTDSILVARLDLSKKRAVAVSLPRDLLVKTPGSLSFTKINTLYQSGVRSEPETPTRIIQEKIENITGLTISRTVILDLVSFSRVVEALGGVTIYVEEDIDDTRFPTPEGGYTTFSIEKGWQHLDGETASKYIRTRHTPKGDIARVARQQQVAYAIKNKISGLHPLFDLKTLFDVLGSLKGRLKTDLSPGEITYLWRNQRDFEEKHVVFRAIDAFEKDSLLTSASASLGGENASVLVPRAGIENYEEIQEFIKNLIGD